MRLSTKGVYALEAVLAIALQPPDSLVSVREISKITGQSDRYLEQIFSLLKKNGIIRGKRGNQGGYHLASPIDKLTCGQVLRAAEGSLEPVFCVGQGKQASCDKLDNCLTRPVWKTIGEEISQVVDSVTLADLVQAYNSGNYPQQADFII